MHQTVVLPAPFKALVNEHHQYIRSVCCSAQGEFLERMRAALPAESHGFRSFYSSLTGGVVTDPALMVLPIDDHMVHRGHAGAKPFYSAT